MTYETVLYDVAERICTITLNRPDRLNALDNVLIEELSSYFDGLVTDRDVRVVVLRGAGRAFCAGLDLKELGAPGSKLNSSVAAPDAAKLRIYELGEAGQPARLADLPRLRAAQQGKVFTAELPNPVFRLSDLPFLGDGRAREGEASTAADGDVRDALPRRRGAARRLPREPPRCDRRLAPRRRPRAARPRGGGARDSPERSSRAVGLVRAALARRRAAAARLRHLARDHAGAPPSLLHLAPRSGGAPLRPRRPALARL